MSVLSFDRVREGEALPALSLAVTPSVIVAGALASGDFEVVHHDVQAARARGTPDVFMNILTTNGYVQRFVNDWAAPAGRIRSVELRLGVPNFAGDTLKLTGVVRAKHARRAHRGGRGHRGQPLRRARRRDGARGAAMTHPLRDQAAVVGIGATEFSKDSGRSELKLAVEAIQAAVQEAGLKLSEVDGLCTYAMDRNPEIEVFRNIGGRELKFFSRIDYGGGAACAPLLQAALAVHAGVAEVVVCYRAMNERSQYRFGQAFVPAPVPSAEGANWGWTVPFGLATPASWVALAARRYMHDFGATSEDFGRVSVACRRHAADKSARLVLSEAHHAGRAPGLALDRRTAAPARLLPGERRGGGDRGDGRCAGARAAPEARPDPRRRAGCDG